MDNDSQRLDPNLDADRGMAANLTDKEHIQHLTFFNEQLREEHYRMVVKHVAFRDATFKVMAKILKLVHQIDEVTD